MMMRKYRIPIAVSLTVVMLLVAIMTVVDHMLLRLNYDYLCWRVTNPSGPSGTRFQQVIHTTTLNDIPTLIERMNEEDMWWVEKLLQAWFGLPPEVANADSSRQDAWRSWWMENKSKLHELRLITDPQF